jgi:hypothetical protein
MLIRTKLEEFMSSAERVGKYRQLVQGLRDLRIDEILLEMGLPEPVATNSSNAGNAALAALYQSLGYQECLHTLFTLDEIVFKTKDFPIADFGAQEKLNLTDSETRKFSGV